MKETAFVFVSLQQQRPDLPRLLVSTATVDDSLCLSVSLSLSLLMACCVLVCLLHAQAASYLLGDSYNLGYNMQE
jgi:hypothetical protein